MNIFRTALRCAALAAALFAVPSHASFYPPDYAVCERITRVDTGPFTISRTVHNPYKSNIQLSISYRGYLLDKHDARDIQFYVRVNGQDAIVQASPGSFGDAYVFLNAGPRACHICADYPPYNQDEACRARIDAGNLNVDWMCASPTDVEKQLLPGARDGVEVRDAWNIEVAATAGGEWDSAFGANFHAWLDPAGC